MESKHTIYHPKSPKEMKSLSLSQYFLKSPSPRSSQKPKLKLLHSKAFAHKSKHNKGQGMTEYLIIVALIAIGSIAIVRTVGGSLRTGFAKVSMGIQGKGNPSSVRDPKVSKSQYKRNDMSDFTNGAIE